MTFSIQLAILNMIDQLEDEMKEVGFEVHSVHLGDNLYNDYIRETSVDIAAYVCHDDQIEPDEWYFTYVVRAETDMFDYEQLKDTYARRNVVDIFG